VLGEAIQAIRKTGILDKINGKEEKVMMLWQNGTIEQIERWPKVTP
jgi:hypothetical protein